VTEKDATLQDKSNKLGAYVLVSPTVILETSLMEQDHVKPVVDEIYNYVLGAKVHSPVSSSNQLTDIEQGCSRSQEGRRQG